MIPVDLTVVDFNPAIVDALRSNPSVVISNAKKGSLKDLVALADHAELVPSRYLLDVLAIFCSQIEEDPASTLRRNPQQASSYLVSAATTMQGIVNLWSKSSETPTRTFGPILIKSWPRIEQWIEFLDAASKKQSKVGFGEFQTLVQGLFQIALGCKDSKSQAYFEKRVPSLIAERWSAENTPGDDGFYATNMMGLCLRTADDKTLFLKAFVQRASITDQGFVDRLLEQGKTLLRQTQKNFCAIGSYLYTLLSIKSTPVWGSLMVSGGLDFVLRVFAILPKETRISDGWRSSLKTCIDFFRESLVTKKGYPFLLEMIKGGFLESFINCGPRFWELEEAEVATCKSLLTTIPGYFYIFPVLKYVSSALEKIGSEGRKKLCKTCVEEEWVALETRLLEQVIRKRFFDDSQQGYAQAFCYNCKKGNPNGTFSKCAGCRRALYCSKECQKVDWKEGRHRDDCKILAAMDDEVYVDDRMIRKSVEFASMITRREMDRHSPGLRSQLHSKLPGHSMGQARVVAYPMSSPVVLDIGSALDILKDVSKFGMKGLEETIKMNMEAPDNRSRWVQMCLPGGEGETVDLLKLRVPPHGIVSRLKKMPESVQIRRPPAVDGSGLELEAQWDEVDEVLHLLGLKSADEWYSSGPGALNRLNKKVGSIIIERQLVMKNEDF